MEGLLSLLLALIGLQVPNSASAFFIPVPSVFAPTMKFGCPAPGTIFTYDVLAWNTNRRNRMIANERDQLDCWITSDAQGRYNWVAGLGPHLDDRDLAEKKLAGDLWPLRVGHARKASAYGLPSRFSEVEYTVDAYGLAVVPAGVHWAYKIRKDYYWQNKLIFTTTLWWSRSLRWTILQWIGATGNYSAGWWSMAASALPRVRSAIPSPACPLQCNGWRPISGCG